MGYSNDVTRISDSRQSVITTAVIGDKAGNSTAPLMNRQIRQLLNSVTTSDFIYCCALAIWVFMCMLNMSFFALPLDGLIKYMRIACVALVVLSELARMRTAQASLSGTFLCFALFLIAWHVDQRLLIDMIVFVWGARGRNPRALVMTAAIAMIASLVLVVASAHFGIISNYRSISANGRVREYLGFRYALYPSAALFGITCAMLYLSKRRAFLPLAICLAFMNWYLFSKTDSRLSFYLSIAAIVMSGLCYTPVETVLKNRRFRTVAASSFVVCAFISLVLAITYDPSNELLKGINQALDGRLYFGHAGFDRYGLTLFGTSLSGDLVGNGLNIHGEHNIGEYFYIDCIYVRMIIEEGVFFFLAYLVAMTAVTVKAFNSNNTVLAILLVCLALHGMVDNLMINLFYNPFLLIIGGLLSKQHQTSLSFSGNDFWGFRKYELSLRVM